VAVTATINQIVRAMCLEDPEAAFAELRAGRLDGFDADCISTLTRACVMAPPGHSLVAPDLAGIEARVNAWGAGDADALDVFRAKKDPYIRCAAKLFQVDPGDLTKDNPGGVSKLMRGIGKRCELGCGYQMGGPKFHDTVIKYGGKWSDIPLTPKECVDGWRELHWPIVQWWDTLEQAACNAVAVPDTWYPAGPVRFVANDGTLFCELPSGRSLVYHDARIEQFRMLDAFSGQWRMRTGLRYFGKQNGVPGRVATYGGHWCENVVQAMSRDLLALALIQFHADGLPVVLHVHDEAVAEVPDALVPEVKAYMADVMRRRPPWAPDLPIDVDTMVSKRYRK
jgi:DNA polymerase